MSRGVICCHPFQRFIDVGKIGKQCDGTILPRKSHHYPDQTGNYTNIEDAIIRWRNNSFRRFIRYAIIMMPVHFERYRQTFNISGTLVGN